MRLPVPRVQVRTTLLAFFTCVFALVAFSIKLKVTALLREDGGGGGARKGGRTHATHRVARPGHLRPLASALWSRQVCPRALRHSWGSS